MPTAIRVIGRNQYGAGLNGGETAFAHLSLRLFFDYSKYTASPAAALFVDISKAFGSLLRRVLFEPDAGDEAWLHSLKSAGFSQDDIATVLSVVESGVCFSGGVADDVPGSAYSLAITHAFHTNTWFSQESLPGVVRTNRGCLAGLPLADVVFSLLFACVLFRFRGAIRANGLNSSYLLDGVSHEFDEFVFADDAVYPIFISGPKPGCVDLVDRCLAVSSVIATTALSFGLVINFAAGKSEALCRFVGPAAKAVRRRIHEEGGSLAFPVHQGKRRLVFLYYL